MNGAAFVKMLSGVVGLVVASLFPTEALMTLMWCGFLLGIIDTATGVSALAYRSEVFSIKVFIAKIGRKLIRGMAYLSMAWVVTQILSQALKMPVPLAEPVGFVMSALIATEMLSIIKNLSAAHNNIPVIDKYFKKWAKLIRESMLAEQEEAISGTHPAKENN